LPFLGFDKNTKANLAKGEASHQALIYEGNDVYTGGVSPIGAYDGNRMQRVHENRINDISRTTGEVIEGSDSYPASKENY
jgi:hypothetical protein